MTTPSWHALPSDEALARLESSPDGLTDEAVRQRLERHGPNRLPESRADGALRILLRQLVNPLALILVFAAAVSAALGDALNAGVIAAAVVVNASVGFVQERKVSTALAALRGSVHETAVVTRAGRPVTVDADSVVPGDILVLRQGDRCTADARVIAASDLRTTEASLTGESMPVEKSPMPVDAGAAIADRSSMVFRGTLIAEGTGAAVVTATGADTEFGRLALLVAHERGRDSTPLQQRFGRLAGILGGAFCIIAAGLFAAGLAEGRDPLMMFQTATAVAVAAVPESLPVAVAIVLATGARRILGRGGLVRRMAAAETLGSVTVIATDKTATLTLGQMRVDRLQLAEGGDERGALAMLAASVRAFVENPGAPTDQLRFSGTPVEQAILRRAVDAGVPTDRAAAGYRSLMELPFHARHKYSAALLEDRRAAGATVVLLGAPEAVLERTTMGVPDRAARAEDVARLAADGFRVLAFATAPWPDRELTHDRLRNLTFGGLIVLADPLRPDVAGVIRTAQQAGARVMMVTGDHIQTARYVGRATGILRSEERVLEGTALPADAGSVIDHYDVFARVSPDDKVRIVDALQRRGHAVAMVGDGVNDAPSLLRADIGVAVGSGTDVAKDASDLVLVHDSFRIIVDAIRQGRVIFDNIAKVFVFLLSDAFSEIVLVATAIVAGLPLPLLPAQILWVNIVEDILPAVALATDHAEPGIMRQPPRRSGDMFSGRFLGIVALFGVAMNAMLIALFLRLDAAGDTVYARTMVFAALGTTTLAAVYSIRSLRAPIWRRQPFANRWLNASVLAGLGLYAVAIYAPPVQAVLGTVPLRAADWGVLAIISAITVTVLEVGKRFLFPPRTLVH